jgi:hypothetical protein
MHIAADMASGKQKSDDESLCGGFFYVFNFKIRV